MKAKETTSTNTAFASAGAIVLLNGIAQGSDINERDGRIVHLQTLKSQLFFDVSALGDPSGYIIYWIWDTTPNGAAPAVTDIFKTASFFTVPRQDQAWRFKVLKKQMYNPLFKTETITVVDNVTKYVEVNINLKGKKCSYINTSSAIADIGQGALYMVTFGGNANARYSHHTQVKFTE